MLLASGYRFAPNVSLPRKGLQTVLKLFRYAQLTLLTQLEQILPESGPLLIFSHFSGSQGRCFICLLSSSSLCKDGRRLP